MIGSAMTHDEAVRTLAAERYHLAEMSDAERDAFEAHYFECQQCAHDVHAGALLQDGARAGWAAQTAAPAAAPPIRFAPRTPRRWYASPVLPWGLAATLAIAVGYQSLRPASTPAASSLRALTPVTLRATARGAESIVPVPREGPVTFALDVDPQDAGALTYELHGPGDRVVAQGQAAPPAGGAPLLLLVGRDDLLPPGPYRIVVRDAAAGRDLGEYRFSSAAQ
jgi:anti-sigma factor RsiW